MEGTESNQFWRNRSDRKQLVQIQYTKDNAMQEGPNQSSLRSEGSVARISAFSTAHERPIPDWLEGACHTVIYTLMIQFSTSKEIKRTRQQKHKYQVMHNQTILLY